MSMQFNSGRGLPFRSMVYIGFAVRWRPARRHEARTRDLRRDRPAFPQHKQ
jgi:hypothetical protein